VKLTVIAFTHRPEPWVAEALEMYRKRFPPDWKAELIELKPEARQGSKTTEQILSAEAARLEQAIPKGSLRVVLDERGADLSTKAMADQLLRWHNESQQLTLIIGSADGLHSSIKQSSHAQWRLSSLTLPHALARVILIESLYRAWSTMTGHPYHRE
jgi:23S rRNA (pseudouridine1915-N3)-methyltransferase